MAFAGQANGSRLVSGRQPVVDLVRWRTVNTSAISRARSVPLPVSWTRVKTHHAASAHAVARASAGVR